MTLSNKLSTAMLILSTSIIQWHSIQFWVDVASNIGFLWSIAIEAAAIWLWWHRKAALAFLASLLLIAGPLYSLSAPAYLETQSQILQAMNHQQKIRISQDSINDLKLSLSNYEKNSLSRVGWATRIDETRKALQAEVEELKRLVNKTEHLKQAPMPWFIIVIELLGLAVLLITQVLTIHALRGVSNKSKQTETAEITEITESKNLEYSELATYLSNRLSEALKEKGLSQAEWARQNKVSTKSVSMLINHQKRSEAGKECISKNELNGIYGILSQKC